MSGKNIFSRNRNSSLPMMLLSFSRKYAIDKFHLGDKQKKIKSQKFQRLLVFPEKNTNSVVLVVFKHND